MNSKLEGVDLKESIKEKSSRDDNIYRTNLMIRIKGIQHLKHKIIAIPI